MTPEYPDVARPALQLFGTRPGTKDSSGVYILVIKGRVYFFTDTTINIDPDAETLAEIATLANDFAKSLDFTPRVAMLSFSNFGSVRHPLADKMRDAVEIVSASARISSLTERCRGIRRSSRRSSKIDSLSAACATPTFWSSPA